MSLITVNSSNDGAAGARSMNSNSDRLLKDEISCDLSLLRELRVAHPWLPAEESIRPSSCLRAAKLSALEGVYKEWESIRDFLLCDVFQRPKAKMNKLWYCADREIAVTQRAFKKNDYPYQFLQCHHWILWYGCTEKPFESSIISDHIYLEIKAIVGDSAVFEFVWYENPKMSLPEFYHVHVFWVVDGMVPSLLQPEV